MWNLIETPPVIRMFNDMVSIFNYHCGIIGSVASSGFSSNDLDVVMLPFENEDRVKTIALMQELESRGAVRAADYNQCNRAIYKWKHEGKDIDLFVYTEAEQVEELVNKTAKENWLK